jgi:hypothetical protein
MPNPEPAVTEAKPSVTPAAAERTPGNGENLRRIEGPASGGIDRPQEIISLTPRGGANKDGGSIPQMGCAAVLQDASCSPSFTHASTIPRPSQWAN